MEIKDASIDQLKASAWDASIEITRLKTYIDALMAEVKRRESLPKE